MKQKYSSADTSINKEKLPAIYKFNFEEGSTVVDYGCGKYTEHIVNYCNTKKLKWFGYDKYNQPEEVNNMIPEKADYCICSNVLNVIAEDEIINEIIKEVVKIGAMAIFTIYDGDKSGIGRPTKENCYQRNEKIKSYVERIKKLGYDVKRKRNFIIVMGA